MKQKMTTFSPSKIINGILLANLFAMIVISIQSAWGHEGPGILIFSEFVIVPLLMGIITAWYWNELELTGKKLTLYSILNGILAIALSYLILKEGAICLVIVSPLIFGFIISGVFIGRAMFKAKNKTLNTSVVGLLLLIFIGDSLSDHDHQNKVTDKILIHARPEQIWPHVIAFDPITKKENYWFFKIGLPSPMAATVSAAELGANRKCIFSNGYIFDEQIVEFDTNKKLTFDIIDQPKDPEIMGHIDILRGQFILQDNGDGTSTLIGNSWYKLHVFPTWYYDFWAESITRNVHIRVMEHIKELAEVS